MAGNFSNKSGITEELLNLASVIAGWLRGGLAQFSLALSVLMGGVSGSAIADAAMQSRMVGKEMIRRGMSRGFAAGVLSFGSLLTPIIPPGLGFIIYGTIGQVSIGRHFAAVRSAVQRGRTGSDLAGVRPQLRAFRAEPHFWSLISGVLPRILM